MPSKGEINRCGYYLVRVYKDPDNMDWDTFMQAVGVVDDFRAAHQRALGLVTMGLRSMVRTEGFGDPPLVSQRLKRLPRIVRKLARMGNSDLARLEDIGGCRAVLPTAAAVEAVKARLESRWGDNIKRRREYLASPNAAGYRAHHFVVQRKDRRIEVQLRTVGQQAWANAVEAMDSRRGLNLKDGTGPESLLEYFTLASKMIYSSEYDVPLDDGDAEAFELARRRVVNEGYYKRKSD